MKGKWEQESRLDYKMMVLGEVVTDEIVALRKSSGLQMKTGRPSVSN